MIDVFVAEVETLEALSEVKLGKALGSGIVTAGSIVVAIGILTESSIAGPVGMVIVGVGYIIKQIFRDPTDLENFVQFSSFGNVSGRRHSEAESKPGWYKTEKKFEAWGEDYDEQIRAAVALLCTFRVEAAFSSEHYLYLNEAGNYFSPAFFDGEEAGLRGGTIKMGWIPKGAKLHLKYSEDWANNRDSRELSADVDFGNGGKPKVASSNLSVQVKDDMTLIVQAPKSTPFLDMGEVWNGRAELKGVKNNLKKITLTGSLEVKLGGETFFAKPGEDGELYAPYKSLL